jgi:hypothetical protein
VLLSGVWWSSGGDDDDGELEGGEGQREEGGGIRASGPMFVDVWGDAMARQVQAVWSWVEAHVQTKTNKGCDPDLAFQLGFEESAPTRGEDAQTTLQTDILSWLIKKIRVKYGSRQASQKTLC